MGHRVIKFLLIGQLCLWSGLLVCYLLAPNVVYSNYGISHFGVYKHTILPYGVAFLLCGYFTILAAREIRSTKQIPGQLSQALLVLALCMLAILLTPYTVQPVLDWTHMIAGTILFSFQSVLSGWLVWQHPDQRAVLLFSLQLIGCVIAALSLFHFIQLMFTGQIITQLAFGTLLIHSVLKILQTHK
jgi:hypothetical protein